MDPITPTDDQPPLLISLAVKCPIKPPRAGPNIRNESLLRRPSVRRTFTQLRRFTPRRLAACGDGIGCLPASKPRNIMEAVDSPGALGSVLILHTVHINTPS